MKSHMKGVRGAGPSPGTQENSIRATTASAQKIQPRIQSPDTDMESDISKTEQRLARIHPKVGDPSRPTAW
jgi:hypothetical protein